MDSVPKLVMVMFQRMCRDDEYKVAHRVYSLDYRPIEGNVAEERNAFSTPTFNPNGVYS